MRVVAAANSDDQQEIEWGSVVEIGCRTHREMQLRICENKDKIYYTKRGVLIAGFFILKEENINENMKREESMET